MATTTNYSWTTPDDTDLVKDGAGAIRTLGSSVDTTVKALSPGTTAGDIDYYTTSTAKARVAIGTAGQVLTVNSGATAPQWSTPGTGGFNWTLVNSPSGTALTGASSITVSGITNANRLMVIIDRASCAAGNRDIEFRINNDTGNNYFTPGLSMSTAGSPTLDMLSGEATNRISMGSITANATSQFSGYVMITGGDTANNKMFEAVGACNQDGSGGTTRILGGRWSGSATISSIVLLSNAASNFDNGTIWVYKS
jgi:hypothetical protein